MAVQLGGGNPELYNHKRVQHFERLGIPPLDRKMDSCCGTFQGRNNALCNSQSNSVGVHHQAEMQPSFGDARRRRFFKPPSKCENQKYEEIVLISPFLEHAHLRLQKGLL
jgi:hypothetical protein